MNTTATFPIVRNYKSVTKEFRNASIAIFDDGDEQWGNYRINIYHEAWTGARWLPVCQNDNAYSLDDAFSKARAIRDSFGWQKR